MVKCYLHVQTYNTYIHILWWDKWVCIILWFDLFILAFFFLGMWWEHAWMSMIDDMDDVQGWWLYIDERCVVHSYMMWWWVWKDVLVMTRRCDRLTTVMTDDVMFPWWRVWWFWVEDDHGHESGVLMFQMCLSCMLCLVTLMCWYLLAAVWSASRG